MSEKITKEELEKKLEPVSDAVAGAVRTVEEITRKTAKKAGAAAQEAGPAVKAAVDLVTPTVKAAAKAAAPAAQKAKKTVREAGKKAAAALVPEVYVQWNGQEISCADLVDRARKDYKAGHRNAILSCRLYVKPEDGLAYYVINDTEGRIPL